MANISYKENGHPAFVFLSLVIDEEKLKGLNTEGFPKEAHAVAAFTVSNSQITFARMFS